VPHAVCVYEANFEKEWTVRSHITNGFENAVACMKKIF